MSSIDERVVQMKFDNGQFQKGVAETNQSLDSLKKGLDLNASAKSLDSLNNAGSKFSLANIASGISDLSARFGSLSVIGVTALANITSKAVDAGLQLAKSLTIGPIADGFADYNAKLVSVQTIMNATGSSIGTVDGYFKQLDTYADKTIYNLTDMTGAFAKFTNAGVGMDKSVPAIKGIANMVALAGQDAGAASIAMYNLSQSIAGGFLTTTDYKSLNLANVATKEWKDQMIQGAVAAGKLKKGTDGMYTIPGAKGAYTDAALFNEALSEGWASADVLMEVLGDYGDTQTDIGKKAQAAAQDVKSFGMMMDTLKASVGTGWTDTFEILLGNVEEAKALFTPLTNTVGGFLDMVSEARNKPLLEWKELGGRTAAIDAIRNAFTALMSILVPIKEAFFEIFPATTGKQLADITNAVRDFTANLKPSEQTIANIKSTFKGLFAVLDIGRMLISGVIGVFARLFGSLAGGSSGIFAITGRVGDFLVAIRDAIKNGEGFTRFFEILGDVLVIPINGIKNIVNWIGSLFQGMSGISTDGATGAIENLKSSVGKLKPVGDTVGRVWEGLTNIFRKALDIGKRMADKLAEAFKNLGGGMAEGMKFDPNTVLGILGTGLLGGIFVIIKKFVKMIKGAIDDIGSGGGLLNSVKDAFGGLTDTLSAMQSTLKASTLILIAGAIALLTVSVVQLAKIDPGKLASALGAITVMFVQLSIAMGILSKINIMTGISTMVAIGIAMILLSTAVNILASAVVKLSGLDWNGLAKGLVGVTVLLGGLAVAAKIMSRSAPGLIPTAIGMIAVAAAVKILASAVKDFSEMNWDEMARGLVGVGVVLGALVLFGKMASINKGAVVQAGGLILLGAALKIMASAVGDFAAMDIGKLLQGLGALTAVLGILTVFSKVINPAGMLGVSTALVILGGALKIMASALSDFGDIPWDSLGRGLLGMAGSLVVIAAAMTIMPKNMLVTATSLVIVGGALKIVASALADMGGMSIEEIAKSLVTLTLSLAILAGALNLMTSALPGALALIVAAGALSILSTVLMALGAMAIMDIVTGLGALVGVFVVIGLAGLLLGPVVPVLIGLGVAIALLGVGAVLAGAGLLAFSAGLTALSIAGAAGAAALIAVVKGLLDILPYAFTQVGLALVALAQVLGQNIQVFIDLGIKLLTGLLDGLRQVLPSILTFVFDMVFMILNSIASNIQRFVDVGMRIIVGFLQGVAGQLGNVINAAVDIIVTFLNGLANGMPRILDAGTNLIIEFVQGIGRNASRLVTAGYDTIITFVNSLATTIRNNTDKMNAAGANLASAIIDGMTSGIRNGISSVAAAAKNVAQGALDTVKGWLGIHSPSREFMKLGRFSSEGMAIGIANYGYKVNSAALDVGKTALNTMQDTISNVGANLNGVVDVNPVIRPVLDLTSVRREAQNLGSIMGTDTLQLGATHAKASVISADVRAAQEVTRSRGEADIAAERENITFNQYNNSPKALSRAEIYRQTKNQLSVVKQ